MLTGKFQAIEFRQALHEIGNRFAKARGQIFLGSACVFDRIVKQRSHDGHGIHLPLG